MDDEDIETAALNEALNDQKRVGYFKGYIAAVAQAIRYITTVVFLNMYALTSCTSFRLIAPHKCVLWILNF